jgi:hypothetical protein
MCAKLSRFHLVSFGIETVLESDDAWMRERAHDLQFSILRDGLCCSIYEKEKNKNKKP